MSVGTSSPAANVANVPAIAPLRLPYHPALKERYEIDAGQWRVLIDAIFPAAQTMESVIMAIGYCKARKLDIFKHQVHIVPIWSQERHTYIETVWPSISELRTTAFRTRSYAGTDPTAWGDDKTMSWGTGAQTVEVIFPEWAQVTVYRLVEGQRCAFPGPRVYWLETFAHTKGGGPNAMWTKRPRGQLEKCAQAAALRNAFPEEIGGDLSSDEAEGITEYRQHIEVPADAPAPRLSKVEQMAAALDAQSEPMDETPGEPDEPPPADPASTEPLSQPEQEQFSAEQWIAAVNILTTIKSCQEFIRDALPTVPESIRPQVLAAVNAHIKAIKATRGERTNGNT